MGSILTPKKLPYRLRPNDKLYFLHIIKTAGTTLMRILASHFDKHEVCHTPFLHDLARTPAAALSRARLYIGHVGFKLAEYVPDDLIYLTMLREPMDHVLSVFLANRRGMGRPTTCSREQLIGELRDYLSDEETAVQLRDVQVFTLTIWHKIWGARRTALAARDALTEEDWRSVRQDKIAAFRNEPRPWLVGQASARLEKFAFVGLVERMSDSVRLLDATFGWEKCSEVPRLNVTAEKLRKEDLPADILGRLEELTRLDQQLYARGQALFDRRWRQCMGWSQPRTEVPLLRRAG